MDGWTGVGCSMRVHFASPFSLAASVGVRKIRRPNTDNVDPFLERNELILLHSFSLTTPLPPANERHTCMPDFPALLASLNGFFLR